MLLLQELAIHQYTFTWKRVSQYSRISIPRCRCFPVNWTVLGNTTMVEWRLGRVSSVPRASRVPPRYTNPSRTRGLPRRFLSRTMVRLNYYVAPPFTETTVKVSRLRVHDCNLRTWSSLCERLTTTTQYDHSMYEQRYALAIIKCIRRLDCYWIKVLVG